MIEPGGSIEDRLVVSVDVKSGIARNSRRYKNTKESVCQQEPKEGERNVC